MSSDARWAPTISLLSLLCSLSVLSTVVVPLNARADSSQLTLLNSVFSFKSQGDIYGPWSTQSLEYQWQTQSDVPSLTLYNRNDDDRPSSSKSQSFFVDDYHTWSGRFYTYAQAGFSNGTLEPNRAFYAEADGKFGRELSLVLGTGAGVVANPNGTTTRYVSAGPEYYAGPVSVTLRFLPSSTDGIRSAATELATQYNRAGRDRVTLTLINGTAPSILVGLPALTTFERSSQGTLTWLHCLTPHLGFEIAGSLISNVGASQGDNYGGRAITFGVFYGRPTPLLF
jgi:YaiO family outer membrane protein